LTSNDPVKQFLSFDGKPQPIKKEEEDLNSSNNFFCPNCGQPMPSLNCYCSHCGMYVGEQSDSNLSQLNTSIKEIVNEEKHKSNHMGAFIGIIVLVIIVFVLLSLLGYFDIHGLQKEGKIVRKVTEKEDAVKPFSNVPLQFTSTKPSGYVDYLFTTEAEIRTDLKTLTSKPKNKIPSSTSYLKENVFQSATKTKKVTPTKVKKTMTLTPTTCPGAPPQRLEVGEDAVICTRSDNVFLRTGAGKRFSIIRAVSTGTVLKVTGGPRCSDNWSFWAVELPDGTSGWMSEGGDEIDPYFLCPN